MPAQHLLEDARGESAPAIAIRIPIRLVGTIILALVALTLVALATWQVDDPSFSYASGEPARNWLGFPGAVIADIAFQVFGLAILVVLVPPALWGWAYFRRQSPSRMGLRLLAWVGASLLSCGLFAFVLAPESWPLPTGLGGLVGSGFMTLATFATGDEPQPVTAVLFAIIIAAPTLALFWIGTGLGRVAVPKVAKPAKGKGRAKAAPVPEVEDDTPERDSMFDVLLGMLEHLGYSARAALKRANASLAARRAAEAEQQAWRGEAVEPSLHGSPIAPARAEPPLVAERRVVPQAADEPPFDDYADIEGDDDETADEPRWEMQTPLRGPMAKGTAPAAAVSPRVAAPAPRPQQGQRAVREAQGSLLDEQSGGFELPELSLLAQPKHKGIAPEHAPERLEAMARKLESVLEDFGVKGDIINVRPGPVVTLYELEPAPGIKSSRVISLADDIARSMSAISARVAVVPGRNAIGIELPNESRETVYLREMLASSDFEKMKGKLPDLPRQDHRRRADHRRPRPHAAPVDRRHHRLGQVGGDQHLHPVAALPDDAGAVPADHDRPQDAGALDL